MNDFEKLIDSLPMSEYSQNKYKKKEFEADIDKLETYEQIRQFLYDKCTSGFKKIQNGDIKLYKNFLEIYCYSKHSLNNTILEAIQFPQGSCFKSKEQWLKENIKLKLDATSIVGWKPDGKHYDPVKKKTYSLFSPTKFYDVSQVEVDEREYLNQFQEQKFSLKEMLSLALIEIKKNGFTMKVMQSKNGEILPETMIYDPKTKELFFTSGMSQNTMCYNFIREYVHYLAFKNDSKYDRDAYAFCAESITYVLVKKYCAIDFKTSGIDIDSRLNYESAIKFFKDKNIKDAVGSIISDFDGMDKYIHDITYFEPKKEKVSKHKGEER